jgi:trk system potassium uptake protein TrkH
MYAFLALSGSFIISITDNLPISTCLFESASAIGTVGLSLGITPALSTVSHMVLILLMFIGRVGGLTLVYATVTGRNTEVSLCPVEKIIIG